MMVQLIIFYNSLFPKSRDFVALRFPSKNLSRVTPLVPMLILLPLFKSTVSSESDGTGLSFTYNNTDLQQVTNN